MKYVFIFFTLTLTSANSNCLQENIETFICESKAIESVPLNRYTCSDINKQISCSDNLYSNGCFNSIPDSRFTIKTRHRAAAKILFPESQCGFTKNGESFK